jgi:hypothetical protein
MRDGARAQDASIVFRWRACPLLPGHVGEIVMLITLV